MVPTYISSRGDVNNDRYYLLTPNGPKMLLYQPTCIFDRWWIFCGRFRILSMSRIQVTRLRILAWLAASIAFHERTIIHAYEGVKIN